VEQTFPHVIDLAKHRQLGGQFIKTMQLYNTRHASEKSEAIAYICKKMPVIPFNRVVDTKRIIRKMEGRGGGEAQGFADPQKNSLGILCGYKLG
jgi:hypothetical protein